MSAPDNNGSKAPPSLLSDSAQGAADNGSRILASLEGRVAAGQPRARGEAPSRKPLYAVLAAAIVGIGAIGAWQWQRAGDDDAAGRQVAATAVHEAGHDAGHAGSAPVAASAATMRMAANGTGAAASAANVSGAATPGASAAAATVAAASAPQPAVIVADDSPAPAAPAAASSSTAARPGDAGRLARALTDGMPAGSKSSAAPAASKHANAAPRDVAKPAAGGSKTAAHGAAPAAPHDAKAHHEDTRLAAKHAPQKQAKAKQKDDPDADLLAVLIARTKPYEQKSAKGAATSGSSTKAAPAEKARKATLAEQVAECDKNGFFKGQICRWRVCSGRWGTDPSCPSSAPPASSPSAANVATQSQ